LAIAVARFAVDGPEGRCLAGDGAFLSLPLVEETDPVVDGVSFLGRPHGLAGADLIGRRGVFFEGGVP
jgi:hypothetical protein